MEIFEAIDNRKTIRKFDSYIPSTDEVKRIIESARLAPSAVNAQNWEFIAIYNDEIKHKMAQEVLNGYDRIESDLSEEDKLSVDRYKGHSTFFEKAPVVIVCVLNDAPSFLGGVLEKTTLTKEEISAMRPDSYLLSMGGAIENMLLAAYAQNLGTCWMVAPVVGVSGMKKILNLGDNQKIVSIISVGRVSKDYTDKRSNKKPLEDIMKIIK